MGFDIMINFKWPYFSTDPSEFWRRWHISLSSWLRDYLYIPLGGNRQSVILTYRNLFITMLLGGLWHGASWTFVVWGMYHGVLLIGYRIGSKVFTNFRCPEIVFLKKIWFILKVMFFFQLVCLGWLIFRAESMLQVAQMLSAIFKQPFSAGVAPLVKELIFFIFLLLVIQVIQYRRDDLLIVLKWKTMVRAIIYFICFYSFMFWGVEGGKEFVYFQF